MNPRNAFTSVLIFGLSVLAGFTFPLVAAVIFALAGLCLLLDLPFRARRYRAHRRFYCGSALGRHGQELGEQRR